MKLKVKKMGISTGGPLIAVLNQDDAIALDLHPLDRIKIFKDKKIETVVVDISKGRRVTAGYIGILDEIADEFKLNDGEIVRVEVARKPVSLEYIKKKLDGEHLSKNEIDQIVWDIVHNKLSDIELTFFIAGSYCHPNNMDETVWLTKAMVNEGDIFKINKKIIMDKHCIGGIPGNRTTPVVVPILAAAGYTLPKTSSRAITSPAGTADTMEVFCKVVFSVEQMKKIVEKTNACIVWGGALNLAPADDKIINVEKCLMIDAESQLLASIMAKKHSVSSTHVVIDIPIGPNTKIDNAKKAQHLKNKFQEIGKKLGMKVKVVLTDGNQPIGNGIGPSLEAIDVLKVLRQDEDRPIDLEKKCLGLAADLFQMAGRKNGLQLAKEILKSGKAYDKMKQIIKAQEGDPNVRPEDIIIDKYSIDFTARKSGTIKKINNLEIAKIARISGAPQNKGAGIFLYKHLGDKVKKGEKIFTVYAGNQNKIDYVRQVLNTMPNIIIY